MNFFDADEVVPCILRHDQWVFLGGLHYAGRCASDLDSKGSFFFSILICNFAVGHGDLLCD